MRLALKILAGLVLLVILLPIAAFGVLQTRVGKDWLAEATGAQGIEGLVPFDMRIAELRHQDWLVAKNVHLAIAPADLLHLQLTIKDLSADMVDVLRLPEGGGESSGGGGAPPIDIALRSARIKKLHLAEPVLGEAMTAAVGARGFFGDDRIEGHLAVDRTDGQPGRIALDAALHDGQLKLVGVADEPSGALMRRFTGQTAPLHVEVNGEGLLADWRGEIQGSAGALAELRTRLRLEGQRLTVQGDAAAPGFLPQPLQHFAFEAAAALDRKEVQRLHVAADAATLDAHGSYGETKRVEARVEIPDLAAFAPLSGSASARAVAEIDGDRLVLSHLEATDGSATLTGSGEKKGEEISGEAQLAVADLSHYGTFTGAAQLDAHVSTVAGAIVANLNGNLRDVSAGGAAIGSGTLNGQGRYGGGVGTATIDARLADLAAASGTARAAVLHLTADRAFDGAMTAALDGDVEGVATGAPQADALIGEKMTLAARARRDATGTLRLESATAEGAAFRATASGTLSDWLAAAFTLDLPRLAAMGDGAAGRVSVRGTANGPLDAVEVAAKIEAADVVYGARRLDRLVADIAGTETGASLYATFKAAGLDGTLQGAIARQGETIAVKNLRLDASGTKVNADLSLVPAARTATGTVTARIADLAPWSALAGMNLAGRASADAKLAGRDVDLKLDAARLAAGETKVEKLAGTAHVADLLGAPSGRVQLSLANARFAGGEIAAFRLDAKAPKPGAVSFDGDLRGRLQENVQLAFGGVLDLGAQGETLRLDRLAGMLASARVALNKPMAASRRPGGYAITGLDLALGQGRIGGSASLDGATIAAALSARRLPVGLLAKFAGQEAEGELGLELSASGTLDRPEARLLIDGRGLHTRPEIPPIGLVAEARLSNQRVDLRGRVDGLEAAALGFSGFAPLRLRKSPLSVEVPPNEALKLHIEGDGELASLVDLLPVGEDRLSGRFHLDATVQGTAAAPKAAGVLSLANGRYENLALGTVVSDINAELAGNNDRFVLRRFSARDGSSGTLAAEGAVVLSATPGPAFELAASLRRFRVVGRDDMKALTSGEARVSGTLTQPRIAARLRVDQAELRVPDRPPLSAAKLDVVEINSRTGQRPPPEAAKEKAPQFPATLDVSVEIPGQTFVRGRGLDSEWKGHIDVTGTTASPQIVGRLEVVHGSFDVLGRRFNLSRGIISFDGGNKIDPRLDILAEVQAAGTTAQMIIGGSAAAPTLRLTATPEMPQDEILARVLFDRGAGQLTAAQGLQLAQAAASLANGGPGVLDRLRGKLGLDRLDIGSGEGTSTDPTISAGKYVAEGVYLGVDQSVSGESKAKVEVELTPNITVETDVGSRGGGPGIGLNWKMDY